MLQRKGTKLCFNITIEGDLFEQLEEARTTKGGRIPRNEFVKTAIIKLVESCKQSK